MAAGTGSDARTYPLYEIAEANGKVDIVEHRARDASFSMSDDPAIWARLVPHAHKGS